MSSAERESNLKNGCNLDGHVDVLAELEYTKSTAKTYSSDVAEDGYTVLPCTDAEVVPTEFGATYGELPIPVAHQRTAEGAEQTSDSPANGTDDSIEYILAPTTSPERTHGRSPAVPPQSVRSRDEARSLVQETQPHLPSRSNLEVAHEAQTSPVPNSNEVFLSGLSDRESDCSADGVYGPDHNVGNDAIPSVKHQLGKTSHTLEQLGPAEGRVQRRGTHHRSRTGFSRLNNVLSQMHPNIQLSTKAEMVDEAVQLITSYYDILEHNETGNTDPATSHVAQDGQ